MMEVNQSGTEVDQSLGQYLLGLAYAEAQPTNVAEYTASDVEWELAELSITSISADEDEIVIVGETESEDGLLVTVTGVLSIDNVEALDPMRVKGSVSSGTTRTLDTFAEAEIEAQ